MGTNSLIYKAVIFYCLLLNQFVCIHFLGKIFDIDHKTTAKKICEININAMTLQGCSTLLDSNSPYVIHFLALKPSF